MSRLPLDFGCGRLKLAGTLDTAPGTSGLLLVSGGNEVRSGAFSGQSLLAARIARAGFSVFRFDRRGVGDSEGENRGFRSSAGDIKSALEAFRAIAPQVERVIAYGNCDAASALMLAGGAGCDGLVLSNPWTIEENESGEVDTSPPASAIRARYIEKLKNPREVMRLLRGGVDLRKLARGLSKSVRPASERSTLAREMREGLDEFEGPVRILLGTGDRTAQVFEENWDSNDPRIARCEGAGHAYVEPQHRDWLDRQVLSALRG
ncbi:MAG: hydrolase 1, exosortase A system-associated [Erythrobacter sp.]|nr:hydrolase 1, exosortase A system-associated [Erythrobacter sp.]